MGGIEDLKKFREELERLPIKIDITETIDVDKLINIIEEKRKDRKEVSY